MIEFFISSAEDQLDEDDYPILLGFSESLCFGARM